jgi:hypothetical protein
MYAREMFAMLRNARWMMGAAFIGGCVVTAFSQTASLPKEMSKKVPAFRVDPSWPTIGSSAQWPVSP